MNLKKINKFLALFTGITLSVFPLQVLATNFNQSNKEPGIDFFSNYLDDNSVNNNIGNNNNINNSLDLFERNDDSDNAIVLEDNFNDEDEEDYVPVDFYMYATKQTNIFLSDDYNSIVIGTLQKGDFIKITGENKNSFFYTVDYNGMQGYVPETSLSSERFFKKVKKSATVLMDTDVYMDSLLVNYMGSVKAGTKINITSESGDIVEAIRKDGTKVYLLAEATDIKNQNIGSNNVEINNQNIGYDNQSFDNNFDIVNTLDQNNQDNNTKTVPNNKIPVTGKAIVDEALKYVGNPYVHAGNSLTKGTDCSGFTKLIYAKFGYKLPRCSSDQRYIGKAVSINNAQPGDIVCYPGHVAIYMGNGRIVHASTPKNGIKTSTMYTGKRILSIRRII